MKNSEKPKPNDYAFCKPPIARGSRKKTSPAPTIEGAIQYLRQNAAEAQRLELSHVQDGLSMAATLLEVTYQGGPNPLGFSVGDGQAPRTVLFLM